MALSTPDILQAVRALKARGAEFLEVSPGYYARLRLRLANAAIDLKNDLDVLAQFNIMVDHDEQGYLLQMFTKPVADRPTFFLEVIERNNHGGFGANNFKSIFEAIEQEQHRRGNLAATDA
jgi:4-hydroxyphenylpyruvate dioxygenase